MGFDGDAGVIFPEDFIPHPNSQEYRADFAIEGMPVQVKAYVPVEVKLFGEDMVDIEGGPPGKQGIELSLTVAGNGRIPPGIRVKEIAAETEPPLVAKRPAPVKADGGFEIPASARCKLLDSE